VFVAERGVDEIVCIQRNLQEKEKEHLASRILTNQIDSTQHTMPLSNIEPYLPVKKVRVLLLDEGEVELLYPLLVEETPLQVTGNLHFASFEDFYFHIVKSEESNLPKEDLKVTEMGTNNILSDYETKIDVI